MPPAAILDIDGTLVDTNYHHAIAWYRAFRQHGIVLPIWKIHRHIGMGGDQLVTALTSSDVDDSIGDEIRSAEKALYMALINEVEAVSEAREFVADLKQRGHTVVLASSAKADEVEHSLDLLDARGLADAWTTSADVESTKPQPDLVRAAIDKAGSESDGAVMVGDTPWDIEAARGADVPCVAVITGGFSRAELEDAGAVAGFESGAELRASLDETPPGGWGAGWRHRSQRGRGRQRA